MLYLMNIDVEAKKGDNNGKHYGIIVGEGYGLNCDNDTTEKDLYPVGNFF